MTRKAKRKPALPRLTVLSMSRKDLLAFVESVETLRHLVADLQITAEQLDAAMKANVRRKPAVKIVAEDNEA